MKVSPGSSTIFGAATVNVRIIYCYTDAVGYGDPKVRVNSVDVTGSASFTYVTPPTGCDQAQEGTITVSLPATVEGRYNVSGSGWLYNDVATYEVPRAHRDVRVVPATQQYRTVPSGSLALSYMVTNTGAGIDTFTVTTSCTGAGVTGSCSVSPSTVAIAAGDSAAVTVSGTAGGTNGTSAMATLRVAATTDASVRDSTWTEVRVQSAPSSGIVLLNPTGDIDRSACVNLAVATSASYECGGLRLVHALPSTTRLNRTRTPALIYSSETAHPATYVTFDLTSPQNVTLLFVCASAPGASQCGYSGAIGAGETRRFSVPLLSDSLTTGRHAVSVSVQGWRYTPFPTLAFTLGGAGTIAVVNRSASPYGAGWWLTGIDQIVGNVASTDTVLWVGADGSTRTFGSIGTVSGVKRFLAASLDRPDTLFYSGTELYRRRGDDRFTTYFNTGTGYYRKTVSSFGQTMDECTSMAAGGACQGWTMGSAYTLSYSSGKLDSIVAPTAGGSSRRVSLSWNGARIGSITDPDGKSVAFAYDTGTTNLVKRRTDKRSKVTSFDYYVTKLTTVVQDSAAGQLNLSSNYTPSELFGLAGFSPAQASVVIDGPRSDVTDVTQVWTNGFGAPTRVRDAHGRESQVDYDDTWKLLPKRTRNPAGLVSMAHYNARALTDSLVVVGQTGVTDTARIRYVWDTKWRSAISVRDPKNVLDSTSYDGTTGALLWQQRGASSSRRVSFSYVPSGVAAGQVRTVTRPPSSAVDSLYYDANGNLQRSRSAVGFMSLIYRDAAGRDTSSITPIDSSSALDSASAHGNGTRTITRYDAMGRVSVELMAGPARSSPRMGTHAADTVTLTHSYDDEGNRTQSVKSYRQSPSAGLTNLTHSWTYDAVGRAVNETKPGASSSIFVYDPAGNVVQTTNGRSLSTYGRYDAVGRLVQRIVPEVTAASAHCSTMATQSPFCMYSFPTRLGSVCIPADTMRYRYDAAGQLTVADNRWARVRRGVTAGGLVVSDTLRARAWYVNANDACEEAAPVGLGTYYPQRFDQHVYGLAYHYDLAGRLDTLKHADAIDPCVGRCAQRYAYNGVTGTLDSVIDFAGRVHTFAYDDGGRLTNKVAPGGFADARGYDLDDRLVRRTLTSLVADTLTLDAQGRVKAVRSGYPFNYVSAIYYNGLGAVMAADNLAEQSSVEDFRVDGLGNRQFAARRGSRASGHADADRMRLHSYDSDGRLTQTVDSLTNPLLSTSYDFVRQQAFDGSGNVEWRGEHEHDAVAGEWYDHLRQYYGADDRLALANRHIGISAVSDDSRAGARGVWEMHRYDALGRRVQTHSVRGSGCPNTVTECASYMERTVWDGDQVLYEIRTPESTPTSDTPSGGTYHAFGRVVYLHGGGLDAPLAVSRLGLSGQPAEVTVAPHADWQGDFVGGSLMSGASQAPCTGASGCPVIDWPGGKMTTDGVVPTPTMQAWWGRFLQSQVDASGLRYQRNRFYDPLTGQFTQQDPIGLTGGINLYAFAGGDPVNFRDPLGLCPVPQLCLAGMGAMLGSGGQALINLVGGRPWHEGVVDAAVGGALIGASFGLAAPEASAAFFARRVATAGAAAVGNVASVGGGLTASIVRALQQSSSGIDARRDAVVSAVHGYDNSLRILMSEMSDGAIRISGGSGARLREIILRPDGSSLVRAFNPASKGWDVVADIKPR